MSQILKHFEISNFKKFQNLKVENIGLVNLITGDNNVGKTTFLESLLFSDDNLKLISRYHQTLCEKGIILHSSDRNSKDVKFPESFLSYILNDVSSPLKLYYSFDNIITKVFELKHYKLEDLTEDLKKLRKDKYELTNLKEWILFSRNEIPEELQFLYYDDFDNKYLHKYWPLISFNAGYAKDLHEYTQTIENSLGQIDNKAKEHIIEFMKIFIPGFKDYELRLFGKQKLIGVATEFESNYLPITIYGDGVQKFFRYVVEIYFAKQQNEDRIMIDEIDTGIHFLKLPKIWSAIFKLARETGIQIFATTHSKDCIEAFVESGVVSDIKDNLRLIELEAFKTKTSLKRTIANTYSIEDVRYQLETESNLRGGDVWQ